VSPTARALLALELVQNHPGITADRLAERLEVTPRAVRRYVAILREADIPVMSMSGRAGGYRIGRGVRLPPLLFNAAEALGLVMAVLDGHHQAANPADPVGSALSKILRAMPEPVAAQADAVRTVAAAAPDWAAIRPNPEIAAALVQACAAQRRVHLAYRSEAGSEWSFEADPWAVVVRHGRWYLLCRSLSVDAVRTYRIDRVTEAAILDDEFERPRDLDPVTVLEEHLGVGWEYATDVTIDAPADRCRAWLPRTVGRLEPVDDSTTRLIGSTSDPQWYAVQLARVPVSYHVHGHAEIRDAVRRLGERLLSAADD